MFAECVCTTLRYKYTLTSLYYCDCIFLNVKLLYVRNLFSETSCLYDCCYTINTWMFNKPTNGYTTCEINLILNINLIIKYYVDNALPVFI